MTDPAPLMVCAHCGRAGALYQSGCIDAWRGITVTRDGDGPAAERDGHDGFDPEAFAHMGGWGCSHCGTLTRQLSDLVTDAPTPSVQIDGQLTVDDVIAQDA